MKKAVLTTGAPAAIGPYSQAVRTQVSEMLFCSGQIPLDPTNGQLAAGSAADQTRQVMENIKTIVEAGSFAMDNVVKTTIYLTDMNTFGEVNAVYEKYFTGIFPARATVQVAGLPRGASVEIDCIACK